MQPNAGARRLREMLERADPVLVPGVYYVPLGARLVEQAGFDAAYMTGFGTAAALLGRPDVGLLTIPRWSTTPVASPRRLRPAR